MDDKILSIGLRVVLSFAAILVLIMGSVEFVNGNKVDAIIYFQFAIISMLLHARFAPRSS